jgi:hypothetical protein
MRVPMRVITPLRLSERTEVSTSVEPFSEGASRAAHSSRPALSDCSVSRSCTSSHSSSRACDAACSWVRRASSMGGHIAVDMVTVVGFQGTDAAMRWAGVDLTQQISLVSEPGPSDPRPRPLQPSQRLSKHPLMPRSSSNSSSNRPASVLLLPSKPRILLPC